MKAADLETRFFDELAGMLVASFAEAEDRRLRGDGGGSPKDLARHGRFAVGQFKKARDFLKRVAEWAEAESAKTEAAKANGKLPAKTEARL